MTKHLSNDPITADSPETVEVIEEALGQLWTVANALSRVRAKRERYGVTIFGSARVRVGEVLYEDVKRLAQRLSELGCDIVTGGGPGLMRAANEGATMGDPEDRARSIGIRVALPFEPEANPFVELVYSHQTFFTRLHQFVRLSNAFVVVEGGIGTTLEVFLVWQLLQVRHVDDVPLILVGPMWPDLIAWASRHMARHDPPLASEDDIRIPVCVDTVEQAIALLEPRIRAFEDERKRR
jgi:uncharacterized protein (TIGR00730 family)